MLDKKNAHTAVYTPVISEHAYYRYTGGMDGAVTHHHNGSYKRTRTRAETGREKSKILSPVWRKDQSVMMKIKT